MNWYQKIKNSKYPYIIAEIGSNHNGDMDLARKMIDSAKDCGCDAVKFQSWTPESLIAREEYERNQMYDDSPKKHFGSLREMVEHYYLRPEQHYELNDYCKRIDIEFCSTPFSSEEVSLLVDLGVPFIKVASMDVNNLRLLENIGKSNFPVVLSTGMSTLSEIEIAKNTIENTGNRDIVLLHCISIYPPKYEEINLNNIKMLREVFGYPAGFSDHTIGFSIPLASVVLGTVLIEKHFTIDKDLPGWDHEISADPMEMKILVRESKNIVDSLGSYIRIVYLNEEEKRKKFRRSLVSTRALKKGDIIKETDITAKRPGTGISVNNISYIVGRTLKCDVPKDELIKLEHLM